jgi:hypothetical protein
MAKKVLLIFFTGMFLCICPASAAEAKADELQELKKEIANTYDLLVKMQARLEALEDKQEKQAKKIEKTEQIAATAAKVPAETAAWFSKITFGGDFRYRHENRDDQSNGADRKGRTRHRIRVRLNMAADINEEVDFYLRLATGQDNTSGNETLADSFDSDDIYVDRAYVKYTPTWLDGLSVLGGKFGYPFYRPLKSELLWDDDLNPEGGALVYEKEIADNVDVWAGLGAFWLEVLDSNFNQSLWAAQLGGKYTLENDDYFKGAVSYFDYANLKDQALLDGGDVSGATGNTVNAAGQYAYEFNLFEAAGEFGTKIAGMPVAAYGDFVKNIAQDVKEDKGWLIGLKVNKAKKPNTWQVGYNYRQVERDAVVAEFTDSDFIGGGTAGRGHQFGFKYAFTRNIQAALTYFLSERASSNTDNSYEDTYRLLQLDLVLKF